MTKAIVKCNNIYDIQHIKNLFTINLYIFLVCSSLSVLEFPSQGIKQKNVTNLNTKFNLLITYFGNIISEDVSLDLWWNTLNFVQLTIKTFLQILNAKP